MAAPGLTRLGLNESPCVLAGQKSFSVCVCSRQVMRGSEKKAITLSPPPLSPRAMFGHGLSACFLSNLWLRYGSIMEHWERGVTCGSS